MFGVNWKTKLFGGLAGIAALIHGSGFTIGHVGSVDVVQAVGAVATVLLGLYAKDKNVTGGTTQNDVPGSVSAIGTTPINN